MIKIGGVSIDVSHPKAFATNMEQNCMGMKYEYITKESFRDDSEADWYVKRFGLKGKTDTISDMAELVDIGFVQSCNWEKHLDQAMPFIEKGKPVFIDKPIVGSVKDIERYRELVKRGAKIYGSSAVRYCDEIRDFLKMDVKDRGEVVAIYTSCGVDEFNYAIHAVEGISALAQSKIINGRYLGESAGRENVKAESYMLNFENGVVGIYQIIKDKWYPFKFTVMTTKNTYNINIDNIAELYMSLLREIYREYTTGSSRLADAETLINCTQGMLCCKKSKDSLDGEIVTIDELENTDKFDGYAFESEYAKNAVNIYKD